MSVSIFIIAHAPLASALKNCAVHVYSCDKRTADRVRSFDVLPDADADAISSLVQAAIGAESSQETLVLTDIVGATPSNIAHRTLTLENTSVVAGVNLPMVLTALCHRDENLQEVVRLVKEAGMSSIMQESLQP